MTCRFYHALVLCLVSVVVAGQEPSSAPNPAASAPAGRTVALSHPVPSTEASKHLLSRLKCSYPTAAKNQGITGTVKVRILVDERGRVTAAKPVSGDALLRSAAVNCAELSTYSPFLVDGKPQQVMTEVEISFPPGNVNPGHQATYQHNRSTANSLLSSGNIAGAAELMQQNLELAEKEDPPNQIEIADAASELGHFELKLGKSKEAETMLKQALAAFQSAGVADSPRLARTEEELGGVYLQQKQFDLAETQLTRAVPILTRLKVGGVSEDAQKVISSSLARALFGLASANSQSGNQEQAGTFCDRTITEAKDSDLSQSERKNIYLSCAAVAKSLGKSAASAELQRQADQISSTATKN